MCPARRAGVSGSMNAPRCRTGLVARLAFGLLAGAATALALAAAVAIPAGTWRLEGLAAYVLVCGVLVAIGGATLDPGLIRERMRPGPGGRDRLTLLAGKLLIALHLITAGLDRGRWHLTDRVPPTVRLAALIVFALALAALIWTMHHNPFFSTLVRIQHERGHRLVTSGPYRFVRHPGYLFIMLLLVASAPALGSWLAEAPIAVYLVLILRRLVLEDRFLHEHLPGYRAYAARIRWRLLPGLW